MFALNDSWVWDMWFADDGDLFHLYFLHAPKSLGDPDLRHRNAQIGHAVSADLVTWTRRADALQRGRVGDADATATWTGSVTRGETGLWYMYYTGTTYNGESNIQSICLATSPDLDTWSKHGVVLRADARWYETLGSSDWPEECWRDPWVVLEGDGLWHMYLTARSNEGELRSRGVIGHATSKDMLHWTAAEPVSAPAGFAHVEVVQTARVEGDEIAIFSCTRDHLAGERAAEPAGGEIWMVGRDPEHRAYDLRTAVSIAELGLYCGRLIQDRSGQWQLFGFLAGEQEQFVGAIAGPYPIGLNARERPIAL